MVPLLSIFRTDRSHTCGYRHPETNPSPTSQNRSITFRKDDPITFTIMCEPRLPVQSSYHNLRSSSKGNSLNIFNVHASRLLYPESSIVPSRTRLALFQTPSSTVPQQHSAPAPLCPQCSWRLATSPTFDHRLGSSVMEAERAHKMVSVFMLSLPTSS